MTPEELKNSILQQAIQGKLVEQRPEEGTAEELYQQIQAEKQRLIKEKKIKKDKPLPEITDDEKPFDIPENWKWVRSGYIMQLLDGEKISGKEYPYLEARYLRGNIAATIHNSGKIAHKGERVILVDGENSGEAFLLNEDGYMGSTFKKLFYPSVLFAKYVEYFLLFHKADYRNNKKGAAIPHLNKELFFDMPFPLPPLAEQKRIVTKIEQLLPMIDRYEAAWTKLEAFNKRFPEDMQKSILQQAIQGKLVDQRPEEGTGEELYQQIQAEKQRLIKEKKIKKDKPLPEITDDEKPFEIPESWKWVRLQNISTMCLGKMLDRQKNIGTAAPYLRNVNVRWGAFDLSDVLEMKFEDISDERFLIHAGDIVMCEGGEPGRCAIWEESKDIHFQKALHRIRPFIIHPYFVFYIFRLYSNSGWLNSFFTGTTIKHLTGESLKKIAIPLPPLAEQKRIVAKIEQLLPLCERLK